MRGFSAYFHSLVHDSARDDAMTLARHQSFIASHLLGGLLALAVFPVYLAVVGRPTLVTAFAFVWFLSPIAIAIFLSRYGRLAIAHLISAVNLTGLVMFAAGLTGGVTSFLIAWIVIVPLEAALSTDRRVVLYSIAIACIGLVLLGMGNVFELLPEARSFPQDPVVLALLGSISALVYAGGLAISVQIVHRQSEQAIRQGEKRYRLLAENATDVITRHDVRGKVVFASLASQQILGTSADSLLGDGLFERIHVADRPAYLAALDKCATEKSQVSVEFRARTSKEKSGAHSSESKGYVWLEMRCRLVTLGDDEDGTATDTDNQIVAVTRDIMERKLHEDEVLKARDTAESASKAKTQFLANMSHELRTPLNAIIGFSEILTRQLFGTLGDERYGEYAHLIHESGDHLLHVVNDILDMSKIEAGKFTIVTEPFDAADMVRSSCQIMEHQAEKKNISLTSDISELIPELAADKRACKQMLLNLLSNAIKFTDEGGNVKALLCREGDSINISVVDDGIGIAEEDIAKLGDPFVQADASYGRHYEGTGLGLSVVKGLARLHGGSLAIDSVLGQGTAVTICLPIESSQQGDGDTVSRDDIPSQGEVAAVA